MLPSHNRYNTNCEFRHGNSFKLINEIVNSSIGLTITSPPYNIGKIYEKRKSLEKYLNEYQEFAKYLYDKTNLTGSLCWQVGNYIQNGEVYPLDIFFYNIFKNVGFKLRNRIIWHFGHGLHASKRFSGRYETILWFTKSDQYTFNLDPVRIPAKYPGKRSWKGKNKGKPSGNPLGKNPSDFWTLIDEDWESKVWEIPNVKANHPEKTDHPCQFPVELVQRCILALTNEQDLVLDPFSGAGSTAIASLMHNRNFLGFELDKNYITISKERIEQLKEGTLKVRQLGKPLHKPTGREKVSQIPSEWRQT
ncbi:site-specific DNA-methyltransferase [candidate division WWE3 bacterium CG_4_9_14_3_um_filter_34_6]|uniref:Methyltransferase n=1 Tax=candidate division WWE3 bacterium CG_4_9_14_3_um_filter_34_6 TaxID=1975079 RepID=A0A2M7X504_UNCKA|nr:MAG: site-specific DNA-methyltransferase [candidate division WWE3 bacterium CG_4_9_14_3_um_filter_34_6]